MKLCLGGQVFDFPSVTVASEEMLVIHQEFEAQSEKWFVRVEVKEDGKVKCTSEKAEVK